MNEWADGILSVGGPLELFDEAVNESLDHIDTTSQRPLREYQHDPIGFLVHELGIPEETIRWELNKGYEKHAWDGTREPLVEALESLAAGRNVAVEAGTGTSKTFALGAGGMLWFLCSWENALVVTIAPKQDQLAKNLWKEVGKLWPRVEHRFPQAKPISLQIRMRGGMDDEWTAYGFVCGVGADEESANRARGIHAEHALFIFEETPGIDAAITTAFENTCTAPHNLRLALGNPDHTQDELHKMVEDPEFVAIRISALDYPNVVINELRDPERKDVLNDVQVVPGAASRVSNIRRARKYLDSAPWIYNAMVRGISPTEAQDSLIKWKWCVEASERYSDLAYRQGGRALGVDVANSESGDKGALADWLGACLMEVDAFPCPDNLKLGVRVSLMMALNNIDPRNVGVDSAGIGAGTVNKLKELELYVRALNGGARPEPELEVDGERIVSQEALFTNLRSQMYWQMRDDLQRGQVALPYDEELFKDLTAPLFFLRNGKIYIEQKKEIVKRLGRSPDKGDAVVYGNWVRERTFLNIFPTKQISAFDPDILARDALEGRRVGEVGERVRPREIEALLS